MRKNIRRRAARYFILAMVRFLIYYQSRKTDHNKGMVPGFIRSGSMTILLSEAGMFRAKVILLLPIVCIAAGMKFAPADTIVSPRKIYLNDSMDKESVGLVMDYLEDKNKTLTIEDILNDANGHRELRWKQSVRSTLEFGFTSSAYWVRFRAANPSKDVIHWALEVDYPLIRHIEFYKFTGNELLEKKKAGNSLPFKKRDLFYRNVVFNQVQGPETQSTYYMRFATGGSMDISLWAWTPALLLRKTNNESILFGMYYGILLIVVLFTFLSFFTSKNRSYLFFSIWIAAYTLYQSTINGLSFQYLWPNSVAWERISIPSLILLAIICGLQYGRTFLNLKDNIPKEDGFIRGLIILSVLGMIFDFLAPYPIVLTIVFLIILYVFRLMLLTRSLSRFNPLLATRYYIAAWVVLIAGVSIFSLKSMGLLPSDFVTNWSQQIGSLLHVILMGMAISASLRTITQAKEEAQVRAIDALTAAAVQKDEFLEQTTRKNIEIENLNAELKAHILDLNSAKEKIAVSEEKYRILVEGSNDIIFSLDENFRFVTINSAVITHLNIKPEEVRSKHFLDLIHEGSERVSVSKQLVRQKLDMFAMDKNPISFKTDFKVSFTSEPKELSVYLEFVNIEGRNEIIGKASRIEDDLLLRYVESEKQNLTIENYFITAEDISHRITRNLAKYMDHRKVYIVRIALREMIINAIEHGNLNISFEEKTLAIEGDDYFIFLAERQQDPRYRSRRVHIEYSIDPQKVLYQITDEGDGFDHETILASVAASVNKEMLGHGRGITMAKNCFDEINYNNKGNRVTLVKYFI
jgi:PAS domain-containing protein